MSEYEDLQALAKQGKTPHGNHLLININGRKLRISDPVVTGRQLLLLADKHPPEEHLIYFLTPAGILEDIALEESVDLCGGGIERFITFRSDRSFRFELDSRRQDWGAPQINEATLKRLAQVPAEYRVWHERRDVEDLLIEPGVFVDLSEPGVERFYTGSDATTAGGTASGLPHSDQRYLCDHNMDAEVVSANNQVGLILRDYALSTAVTPNNADLLIILPSSYPDCGPDMFYLYPWVALPNGQWPDRANHPFDFANRQWQRWSRHSNVWRRGTDGIWTMLRRVDAALAELPCAA